MSNNKKFLFYFATITLSSLLSISLVTAKSANENNQKVSALATNGKSQHAHVVKLDDSNFEKTIERGVVIVDFYADWCKPCQRFIPIFNEVAAGMSGTLTFGKLNVDNAPKTVQKYGISSNPTLILFKDGKEVKRQTGFCDAKTLNAFIQ